MNIEIKYITLSLLCLCMLTIHAIAGDKGPSPDKLNGWATEKFFYVTFVPHSNISAMDSVSIYAWTPEATNFRIYIDSIGMVAHRSSQPGQTIEIKLPAEQAFAIHSLPADGSVIKGRGIFIYADEYVTLFSSVSSDNSQASMLIMEDQDAEREIQVSTLPNNLTQGQTGYGYTSCVAVYERTSISFTLRTDAPEAETSCGLKNDSAREYKINASDVIVITGKGNKTDLTGSQWKANKPILVYSGHSASAPAGERSDAFMHPESKLEETGKFFYIPPALPGAKCLIRIFAIGNNTDVYIDGKHLCRLKDTIADYMTWTELEVTDSPHTITADNFISIMSYIYSDKGVASAPVPGFERANTCAEISKFPADSCILSIIYTAGEDGLLPDDLTYKTKEDGQLVWRPLSLLSDGPGRVFSKVYHDQLYFHKYIDISRTEIYGLQAGKRFVCSIYGYNDKGAYMHNTDCMSYISKNDTVAPRIDAVFLHEDARMLRGRVKDMPEDDDARSNLGMIYMSDQESENFEFTYKDFCPGEARETTFKLEVIDKSKAAKAVVVFTDRRGNDTVAVYEYAPDSLNFHGARVIGCVAPGFSADTDIWIVNSSSQDMYIYGMNMFDRDKHFALTAPGQGTFTIPASDSVKINIKYTGDEKGAFEDALCLSNGKGEIPYIAIKAMTDIKLIKSNTYWISLDTVDVGSVADTMFYLESRGCKPVVIQDFFEFVDSTNAFQIGADLEGHVLGPGDVFEIPISFSPSREGLFSDTLLFQTDGDELVGYYKDFRVTLRGYGRNGIAVSPPACEDNNLRIYPNPASSGATVVLRNSDWDTRPGQIYLYNALGEKICLLTTPISGADAPGISLNLPGLSPGIYYLLAVNEMGTDYVKLVITP